jgi:two-component system osmolarity sensor histidine kinase EnvZ
LILASATLLARRISQPLRRLSAAAAEVARGRSPNPLPETGPAELKSLAAQFNEMSRQVRELLANRTVLLAGISHDLRTPLTRLRLAIAMLPEDAPGDLIARMERDIEEMDALIAQSVDFARNLGVGNPEELDLGQLIGDLVANRSRVIWQPQTSCRWRVGGLALRRILGNLLENALRYSRDAVEVHLDCGGPLPVISISDRGPGIPESEREAVFRPYYRLEQSRSRQTGGSGLGLAVARQLAEANRFELRLEARLGGGTVAQVRLPSPDLEPSSGPATAPGSRSDSQPGSLAASSAVDGQAGAA